MGASGSKVGRRGSSGAGPSPTGSGLLKPEVAPEASTANMGENPEANPEGPLSAAEYQQRLVGSSKMERFGLGEESKGVSLRFACLSQRGYYPEDLYKANQDCYTVLRDFNKQRGDIFFGVFDGHGSDG